MSGSVSSAQRGSTDIRSASCFAAARGATRVRKSEGVVGRTAVALEPVAESDITEPGAYIGPNRENLIESGVRAILAVPMVREGQLIGCLGVTRNQPGEFPYQPGMTALAAIARAEGFTYRARQTAIFLKRAGEAEEREVTLTSDLIIQPGDIVRVAERYF